MLIVDNDDLPAPLRTVAMVENGRVVWSVDPVPGWLGSVLRARAEG